MANTGRLLNIPMEETYFTNMGRLIINNEKTISIQVDLPNKY